MSRVCQTDSSFGPGIGSCRGGFDFTLVFEDSVLGLLPQAAFLLFAPIRLATLRRRRHKVAKNSHLGVLKLVATGCYAISSILLLVIWAKIESYKTKLSILSASLEFLGSLVLVTLSRLEHTRAVRPSHLLQFFLLVLLLCDAVRLRTLFLVDYPSVLVTSASIHTFLTGLLLLLESLDKRELFYSDEDRTLPPEETVGLFGKRLFWYLNGLFKEGYQKILKPGDLFSVDADLASKQRNIAFEDVFRRQKTNKNAPLARTIIRVLWVDLILPVIPRLLQIATSLSQPFLITAMINFVQSKDEPSVNVGYGLIGAFGLNYSLLAISSSWYAQSVARFSTKLRSCLISSLYEQTLRITSKDVNLGSATVLMNVDVEKILNGVKNMHEVWAMVISTGVALYILYTHLGVALIAPFLTTLVATGICTWIGKYMKARQMDWVATTQARVTSISYSIGCIKGVRMLGLTETVLRMLTGLREAEVAAHNFVRKLLVWILLISNVMFQMTTLATYVTFVVIAVTRRDGPSLDFKVLYGSLSALKLVTSPMILVLQQIPQIMASWASLERIQSFLHGDSISHYAGDGLPGSTGIDRIELDPIQTRESFKRQTPSFIVSMENATFAIDDTKSLLFNIQLELPPQSLNMVVGKVGSGKSLLLRSLIGETKLLCGSFQAPSSGTAFCDQTVWLRNATVRENIIAEDTFEEPWYNSVVWSCGLVQDLTEMKKGDMTLIGSKGISLSGGQKNRISLARALYARKPILVADDIFSGLDSATEKLVFDRVFGRNGLLRKSGAMVILATHATYFARHADRIIVLADGHIIEQGTYQELITRNVNLHEISGDYSHENLYDDLLDDIDSEASETAISPNPEPQLEEDEEEDVARRSGDRRSLLFFISAVGTLHCSVYFSLLTLTTAATTIQFLWLKWWAQSASSSKSATMRNLYLFVTITAVNIFLYFLWLGHFALWFIPRSSLALHARQLNALMRAKFSYLVSTDIGTITNRFSQDIVLVDNSLQYSFINVTSELLTIISGISILVVATPPVAAIIPLLAAAGYLIQRVYLRTSRQVRLMDLEAKAPLCTHFLESLAGIVTIRSFGWANSYRDKNNKYLDQSQIPFYLLFAIQNWLNLVLELMVCGLITVIVGLAVVLRSKVDPGYLGLGLVAAMDLGFNFRIIIIAWAEFETSLSAVTRIRQFSKTPSEIQETSQPDPPDSWPMKGSVQFKNLVASYSVDGKPTLNRIDLSIEPGEKIGLCGRTGSGKSSLLATLFGLLHEQDGEILIDNIRTVDVSLSVLRSKIIAMPQDPFFLRGTVRHNLAPWIPEAKMPSVSDAQMQDALEQVQLWEKLSTGMEGGEVSALDVSLDNVESLLSQGERQLFCLARAILMPGKIVVLDEPTSSVDAETDALMQSILCTAFANRTIIAIAHRLDTILSFDRVVVMDAGRIAEVGDPAVLMKTAGSLFRGLVENQGKK
ncbi:putative ATP-binding cassette transporter [Lindgomyces ingoldianus]|uniref:ATP-binding cassette transporter n=1 Tax=Lindgomyces ingoldianus TaxID=673940 RepID=A0ACB6R3N9_9PLEO|nr:putative ATP-binding cassette transporter [Lindgomyces ingoldianus]KAF2472940.1 putative ATP-binding cassette transporter [Lindgomyces ingoldianus]